MRVLVLSDLPVALPEGAIPVTAAGAASSPPDLVVLKGPATFQWMALAVCAQRHGAWVVALSPPPVLPADFVIDERFEGPDSPEAERACLASLQVLRSSRAGGPAVAPALPDAALAAAWHALGQPACITSLVGELRAVNARFAEAVPHEARATLVGRALGEYLLPAGPGAADLAFLLARLPRSGAERGRFLRPSADGHATEVAVTLTRLTGVTGGAELVSVVLVEARSGPPAGLEPPPDARRAPLLIVDDQPDVRESLAWLIDPVPTRLAGSLEEAQVLLRAEPFRAVICDLQLGHRLGTDLLPWLAAHRPELVSRFAVMTGGATDRRAAAAVEAAGAAVLEKPFTRQAVAELLLKLCGLDLDSPESDPGYS